MARKKVAVKRSNKTKKKTAVKRRRKVVREKRHLDPFELKEKEKRKGRTYQWVTVSVMGEQFDEYLDQMLDAGWNPASTKQFPSLRGHRDKKAGGIVVGGQLLMERSAALTAKGKLAQMAAALALLPEKRASGADFDYSRVSASAPSAGDGGFTDLRDAARDRFTKLDRAVPTEIRIELTDREVEASAICHLSLEEYTKRKLQMGMERGEGQLMLVETRSGVYRFANFKVTVQKE